MILGEVFERFAQDSPLSVMAQGVLENALSPRVVDQLFEDVAERQSTRKLLFSSIVDLMALVVCRIRPALGAASPARAVVLEASLKAVSDQLDCTEPGLSAALVHTVAAPLAPVIDAMQGGRSELLPGYHVPILDGHHRAGTEHRLKERRTMRAGVLPGQALVVLDPRLMRATDVILCDDGPAPERSLLDQVLGIVRARDLGIEDRHFGTTGFLFGIADRKAFFVVRQHASTRPWEVAGKRRAGGRIDTGQVFEPTVRATNEAGAILFLGRITVVLDQPTRDGETEIHLLTNVPARDARAKVIAELYRKRWLIETAFAEVAATLNGEVNTLGYPKAVLDAFGVALMASNVLSTVTAALRSVHGDAVMAEDVSGSYVAEEVTMTHRGMMIAIPEDAWVVFQEMVPAELAGILVELAAAVRLPAYPKHTRGPKKPKPKKPSGAKIKHVATAKVLANRQKRTS